MNLIDQLNIQSVQLTENGFTAEMQLTDFHAQPLGFLGGGATLAFAEIAAGMASNQLISADEFAVGKSICAHHLKPTKAEHTLVASAILLHKSTHTHLWEIKMRDANGQLISSITVENAIIKKV